jgi:hypothetical protein
VVKDKMVRRKEEGEKSGYQRNRKIVLVPNPLSKSKFNQLVKQCSKIPE